MPNYTKNCNLIKPLDTELYDVEVQNQNMDKIDEKLGRVLLWENPSPNTAMENGTIINLSSDDYDALDWEYKAGPTSTTLNIQRSVKGHDVQLVYVGYTSQRTFAGRCIVRASDTSYNAQKAFGAIWSNGTSVSLNTTEDIINECCLPVRVYGIKY